jgi:hypothetical protein
VEHAHTGRVHELELGDRDAGAEPSFVREPDRKLSAAAEIKLALQSEGDLIRAAALVDLECREHARP